MAKLSCSEVAPSLRRLLRFNLNQHLCAHRTRWWKLRRRAATDPSRGSRVREWSRLPKCSANLCSIVESRRRGVDLCADPIRFLVSGLILSSCQDGVALSNSCTLRPPLPFFAPGGKTTRFRHLGNRLHSFYLVTQSWHVICYKQDGVF